MWWPMFHAPVLWGLGGIVVLLAIATLVAAGVHRLRPGTDVGELRQRIRTWWVILPPGAGALLLGQLASLLFFGCVSVLAFKEYLSLIPTRPEDRRVLPLAYAAIPVQYLWIGIRWYGMFIVFIPVLLFLFFPMRMVLIGETRDFVRAAATLQWGLMVTVFSLSHAAYLLALPAEGNPAAGGAGLVLYLLFLTQFNDVAQYLCGKTLGRHPVLPKVSPKKTWEGLLGGVATTVALAIVLARWFTPLDRTESLLAGMIIGLGGFLGDVAMSALKRDLGVKDTGRLLPGHGGILDRVDSLTYTAPLFFHFVYYLRY